jgi:hypothetical protein
MGTRTVGGHLSWEVSWVGPDGAMAKRSNRAVISRDRDTG